MEATVFLFGTSIMSVTIKMNQMNYDKTLIIDIHGKKKRKKCLCPSNEQTVTMYKNNKMAGDTNLFMLGVSPV